MRLRYSWCWLRWPYRWGDHLRQPASGVTSSATRPDPVPTSIFTISYSATMPAMQGWWSGNYRIRSWSGGKSLPERVSPPSSTACPNIVEFSAVWHAKVRPQWSMKENWLVLKEVYASYRRWRQYWLPIIFYLLDRWSADTQSCASSPLCPPSMILVVGEWILRWSVAMLWRLFFFCRPLNILTSLWSFYSFQV